jgi:hypothetical protein
LAVSVRKERDDTERGVSDWQRDREDEQRAQCIEADSEPSLKDDGDEVAAVLEVDELLGLYREGQGQEINHSEVSA